jgi:hypothetical protein
VKEIQTMKTKFKKNRRSHSDKTFSRLVPSLFVLALVAGQCPFLYAEDGRTHGSAVVIRTSNVEYLRVGAAPENLNGLPAESRVLYAVGTVEAKEEKTTKRSGQPFAPSIIGDTFDLVGPSGEAIHAVLYPGIEEREGGRQAE